jgi:hypothetical protein
MIADFIDYPAEFDLFSGKVIFIFYYDCLA